ncbi:serine/threonine-protein kinase/endoribonuclease IRE1b-like isoform X1 [Solanum dulcamara]|uniref:serine/threonine-protein kinase/endoribonuclease IRE1b-like isoform X1 n=2 Tax=Solanum dulcamara TaxID=45834 RepID=UPI0024869D9C|nr:serine/threonine-protein kinase/endoribonuclease IRE1b-like isoform X1 [Solanum dulcamara]
MRSFFLIIFFLAIVFIAVVYGAPTNSEGSDPEVEATPSSEVPASSSLLPLKPKSDTAIVAAPDGTVHLLDLKSGEDIWAFRSGASIYSSYQALSDYQGDSNNATIEDDNFYIDCGEDWKLYMHGNGFEKVELPFSVEEFLKQTPYVSAGGIMLGSKKTTVFIVDANTGKLIQSFRSDVFPLEGDTDVGQNPIVPREDVEGWAEAQDTDSEAVNPLYIMRTDYALKYTSSKTGKVLWYLMFADFEASQQCKRIESFLGYPSDQEDQLNSECGVCPTKPAVHRVRNLRSLESLFASGRPQNALSGDVALSTYINPALKPVTELVELPPNKRSAIIHSPPSMTKEFGLMRLPSGDNGHINKVTNSDALVHSYSWNSVVLNTFMLLIAAFSFTYTVLWKRWKSHKQATDPKLQAVTSKKKKSRKSGFSKSSTRNEKNKNNSHNDDTEVSGVVADIGKSGKVLELNLCKYDSLVYHRKIGKLLVSNTEIAKGSNGTIVLEGIYDGRPVAVKRLIQTHHEVALKEIQNLIASDQHPNIVRWYGVEYDQDFVYLALERCTCSLYEFISSVSSSYQKQFSGNDQDAGCLSDCTVKVQWKCGDKDDFLLWKPSGYPSAHLLKLMRDMVLGLAHLHELGIVHRDLKPQNILIVKERSISAKLSDMGISKHLAGDMSSLTKNSTGSGSSGWQAPEQLRHERQTRAVDLFSLGCVLFFCITGGKHPYGDSFERDVNIVNNQKDLFLIENIPEAADLISALLHPYPELRPKAVEILHHPFFWNSEIRLSFLRDASDRVELEDREDGSELLGALESVKTVALGGLWNDKMDSAFINDIGRYRRYKYDSVRDLLRVIRNKLNHYRELSKEIQGILGQVPEGFESYFSTRFPRLLIEVYKVFHTYCLDEDIFKKYFKGNQI